MIIYEEVMMERINSVLLSNIFDDAFLEAANEINTYIMKERLYPKIDAVLSTSVGDRRFKQYVGNFIDRNNQKLHTSGPVYLIPFGDRDKAEFFTLFKVTPKEIRDLVDEVIKTLGSKSEFMLLRGNPIFWVFYLCIRYYTLSKDKKGLNCALAIYALSVCFLNMEQMKVLCNIPSTI